MPHTCGPGRTCRSPGSPAPDPAAAPADCRDAANAGGPACQPAEASGRSPALRPGSPDPTAPRSPTGNGTSAAKPCSTTSVSPRTGPMPATPPGTRSPAPPPHQPHRPAGTARTRPRCPAPTRPAEPPVPQGRAAHPRARSRSETVTARPSTHRLSLKDQPQVRSTGDTFRLLLAFARQTTGKQPSQLSLADLDAPRIGAFLQHLEEQRGNGSATRNARLAAIHSLCRYAALRAPEHATVISQVLAIPPRRRDRAIVSYLTSEE